MKHVSIIIPEGHFSLVNVEGTHQILSWVNEQFQEMGQPVPFKIELVGLSEKVTQSIGLFTVNPNRTISEIKKTDLIIIPAVHGDFEENLMRNNDFIPWIIRHYKSGAEVVSLCIASFFLASTGLLDGKRCSTHWYFANEFRKQFPKAILLDDRILTDSDGIYTSGGAYSFTNLLIYLIEKNVGRELAVAAAKTFMIDIDRSSQSPFMIFSGQKNHGDELVLKVQEYIEKHYPEKITVDELSTQFGIGRRSLERRFKKATANTVLEYAQRVKVEAAKQMLEAGRKTVSEVMYEVGYNDIKAFREVFRRTTFLSPVAYRTKYNKADVTQNVTSAH
jgi:transcriptional regulator GlxA family with amidase domain